MKTLGNLKPAKGSNKKSKRIGRGHGSGWGKTSGKGHKGQKARKGGGVAPGFEGGQTPLYRRLPKYGFTNNANRRVFKEVSLDQLNVFNDGQVVDKAALLEKGLIRNLRQEVKVLGNGKLTKKLEVKVEKVTESVRKAVAQLGGNVEEK